MSTRSTMKTKVILSSRMIVAFCMMFSIPLAASAQSPFLEAHYEFDSNDAPIIDSTGQHANLGLGQNGVEHRFGEDSLLGDDGFSIGLDAPGEGHPTGSFLVMPDAPHSDSFSFSIWMRSFFTGQVQGIVARDNVWWPSPCNFYCLYMDQAQSLVWKTGGVEGIITEDGLIEEGEVYHIAVTHSDTDGPDTGRADRSRIYVNGDLVDEIEGPEEVPSLDSIADANSIYELIWLGTMSSFGGFSGELDDFQLYRTELTAEQISQMYENPGSLANFGQASGDFDGNGMLDIDDINALVAESASGANNGAFDLNEDSLVNSVDIQAWIDLKNTWVGDANLDGEFNSSDLVGVFQSGKFETGEPADWSMGDWTGDGVFSSSDFVAAFQAGGFEVGPRPAAATVPEPNGPIVIAIMLLSIVLPIRRQ